MLLSKNLSIISAGADPGFQHHRDAPLWLPGFSIVKVLCPVELWRGALTLCVLWGLIFCFPLALIHSSVQSLCFRSCCFRKNKCSGDLAEGGRAAVPCGTVPGRVGQSWLRCGCSSFPSSHTPDLYSDFLLFFVLPNDQVPVFSPIQALPHCFTNSPENPSGDAFETFPKSGGGTETQTGWWTGSYKKCHLFCLLTPAYSINS